MIQSNELRIGNWVQTFLTHIPIQVESIGKEGINLFANVNWTHGVSELDSCQDYKDAEGIPLTPEILEKAGFVSTRSGDDFHDRTLWTKVGCQYQYCESGCMVDNTGHYGDYTDIGAVVHLHQLQNLYFALTGMELNIQL